MNRIHHANRIFASYFILSFFLVAQGALPAEALNRADAGSITEFANQGSFEGYPAQEHPGDYRGWPTDSGYINNESMPQEQFGAQFLCLEDYCSDKNPGVHLVETFDRTVRATPGGEHMPRSFSFVIKCDVPDIGCTQHDIYYHTSMVLDWFSPYNRTVSMSLTAGSPSLAGTGFPGYPATGWLYRLSCGAGKSGSCVYETWGVLSAEHVYRRPLPETQTKGHFKVEGVGNWLGTYDTQHKQLTVEVSFDPALLSSWLPDDAMQCSSGCSEVSTAGGANGYVGDPINTRTGAFSYTIPDLAFSTNAGSLAFKRTYLSNSIDRYETSLGHGWTHNLNTRLIFSLPGFVLFQDETANLYRFWDKGNGTYRPYAGVTASLTKNSGAVITYTLVTPAQTKYIFDANGKILSRSDAQDNIWEYSYDEISTKLIRVSADNGTRYLSFAYNEQGLLASVSDHTQRVVSFSYDPFGDLVTATDVLGQDWRYIYNQDHRLLEVRDPQMNIVVRNEYFSPAPENPLNFNDYPITNYSNQDASHTMTIEDDGRTLHLVGNSWKKIPLVYPITQNTVLEFDYKSGAQGEVHGIGLDKDNGQTKDYTFKLYGAENWGLATYNNYSGSAPDWKHYILPIGSYYQFESAYLFFANDHDISSPTAEGYFSNIRIYDLNPLAGRVTRQYDGAGNLVAALTYNPDGTTTIQDGLGNTRVDVYNAAGVLTETRNPLSESTTKIYDKNFRPTQITDAAGAETRLSWSSDGINLTSVTDAAGNTIGITYDDLNNPIAIVDSKGRLTSYEYTGKLVTKTINALGVETTYTYTPEGHLASVTDSLGRTSSYIYDSHGQCISMTDSSGNTWIYVYDDLGRLTDTTDPLGRTSHNEFNAAGQLLKSVRNYDPARPQNDENLYNIVTLYEYDVYGNQTASTDTYGKTSRYVYDAAGRLAKTIDPAGNETTSTYDETGQLVATLDSLGRAVQYEYDPAGRQVKVIDPLGNFTQTTYNPDGTIASSLDALGQTTTYTYDVLKRMIAVTDAQGNVMRTGYDEVGNVISTTDTLGNLTRYEYDALGRQIKVIDPLGNVTETVYDSMGNRLQTIDARGNATTYGYDTQGRLETVTDALGNVTRYEYDSFGRRSAIVAPDGGRTTYIYDLLDRTISVTNALGMTTTTAYDAQGRTLASTDAAGNTTSYTYDDLYRLAAQTNALGDTTSFAYNAVGSRVAITDARGNTTTTSYDALNRAVAVTDPLGNMTSSQYNAVGQVVSTTNALGKSIVYSYDSLGRQVAVRDEQNAITGYVYDAGGRLVNTIDANGIVTRFEYDALGRLIAVVENFRPAYASDEKTNVRTEYTYDQNGNRLGIIDANGHATTFVYDALNRLVSESDAVGNTWQYGYDTRGNRTRLLDANGAETLYTYNPGGQIMEINYPGSGIDVSFEYDEAGRRSAMTDSLGTTIWEYNALNQVISVTDPFGKTVSYGYDSAGNRVSLTYPDGMRVNYAYDSGNRLTNVSGQQSAASYLYDGANRLTNISRPNNVNTSYAYDASSRLLSITHANGPQVLASFEYVYDNVGNRLQAVENLIMPAMPTPTPTPAPTETPTSAPTETETPTPTPAPTETLTPSPSPTQDAGGTPTPDATGTPADEAAVLIARVKEYVAADEIAPQMEKQLLSKLENAAKSLTKGQTEAAINQLQAFINQVQAQRGKKITTDAADALIAQAQAVITQLTPTPPASSTVEMPASSTVEMTPTPTPSPTGTMTPTPTPLAYLPGNVFAASLKLPSLSRFRSDAPVSLSQQQSESVTIDYAYDPLYRLIKADYSNGDLYQYTYDSVGNRLAHESVINGLPSIANYTYDSANRLSAVNGVAHTFDPNGNLLSDGISTYTYDAANRLASVTSNQSSVTSYTYNGLGDRLQETANGVTTTFTMDLNTGLTQALDDGTTTYLYGLGRLAQLNTGALDTEYYLTDALGSVRQLADSDGAITLARTYDPYGVVTAASGPSASGYGFTGEYQSADLVYLRARHYAPGTGRFLTRDTWSGDANRPLSFNRWGYVEGNPVNFVDPTGMSPECAAVAGSADYIKCERIIRGFDPRLGPSLMELALLDLGDDCIAIRFSSFLGYMKLPPPSRLDYEDYGFWFHYLLNEKSIREGKGRVSIGMATAIIASREANVDFLYNKISRPIANAMVIKGRARGIYVAIGSRQKVMENVESSILFMKTLALTNRNDDFCKKGAGAGNCYDSFEQMIQAYVPLELARADMPGIVALAFRDNPSAPSDPNNAPDDWGNVTQYTLDLLPNSDHNPPKGIMDVLRKTRDLNAPFDLDPWSIAWYSNDKGIGQFFIRTPNQATNLCPPAGDCIGQ